MTACRLDRGCGEDPCVCQPPAKPYPRDTEAQVQAVRALCLDPAQAHRMLTRREIMALLR